METIIKELTCTACPMSCRMKVEMQGKEVLSVVGNTCDRGKAYAIDECIEPKRVLTTTVFAVIDGVKKPYSLKTKGLIPRDSFFQALEKINSVAITAPLHIGDVLVENILDTNVDVVVTSF